MKITKITYRRTRNTGNYESQTVEATVELEIDDNAEDAFEGLKNWVIESLYPFHDLEAVKREDFDRDKITYPK